MAKALHVSIAAARAQLSEYINRAAFGGVRVILTSYGRPKAAIVSIEDLRLLEIKKQAGSDVPDSGQRGP